MTQQQYNNNFDREFGWDDTIQKDSEFVFLPDGLYWFTVKEYERGRHTPNPQNPGKLPACPKATVHLTIVANEGETELRHNLFLHSSTEGMLSAFFGAIGQKRKGEPLRMDWNAIIGKVGVCKVGNREYNGNKYNEVKGMIYAEDVDYTKVLNEPQRTNNQRHSINRNNHNNQHREASQEGRSNIGGSKVWS